MAFFDFLYSRKSSEWMKLGEKKLLSVFKNTYLKVPAYKKFIISNKVRGDLIKTLKDFALVPAVTKKNYLRAHNWEELCKIKALRSEPHVMTSTSGSTGEPFYFPRSATIDMQSSYYHEMFLRSSKIARNKSTLVVNCFGMGVWIGGLITYQAFKYVADRGYALTIITPGINKHEIFQAMKNLGQHYDQIILCGYPPFMKDVIDQAKDHGVVWHDFNLKIIFAAEGFSETFRDYMVKHAGLKNVYRDTMNIYGSADIGTMAEETPLCILLRRLALDNKGLYTKLFGQMTRLPTVAQFIPEFLTFEEIDGSVYCTGDNVLPLVRYEIGDNGAVFSYEEVEKICKDVGINLKKEIVLAGLKDTIAELPFVCVYERTDFSTKLYGAIIYPEYIKKGLQGDNLREHITSKFTMYTRYDDKEDEYLEVNIELQPKVKETTWLYSEVASSVSKALIQESAEHKNNTKLMPHGKVEPRIIFWPSEHETHFKVGGKQKWVKY
jgi:phenylacetate-CoA ligase